MNRRGHLRLLDGPLVDTQSERDSLVESMANDLVHAGTANDEAAAIRSLRKRSYAPADIVTLVDDARNLALCGIVSAEMSS
jgi:hypothetical protein